MDDLEGFPWCDKHDTGYRVEAYDPERDEAPEGGREVCTGDDGTDE